MTALLALAGVSRSFGGVRAVHGLGFEVGQASHLVETQRLVQVSARRGAGAAAAVAEAAPPLVLTIQESGGVARTVEAGVKAVL